MALSDKLNKFAFVTVLKPTFFEVTNGAKGVELFTLESLRISNFTQEGPMKTAKGGLNANTVLRYGKTARLEMEDVIGQIAALEALMGVVENEAGAPVTGEIESFLGDGSTKTFNLAYVPSAITNVQVNSTTTTAYAWEGTTIVFQTAPTDNHAIQVTYNYTPAASYSVTNKFATPKWIEGTTFVQNAVTGAREWVKFTMKSFLPDSLYNITMEAEGDFGVMSVAGEVQVDNCGEFFTIGDETNPC